MHIAHRSINSQTVISHVHGEDFTAACTQLPTPAI